MVAVAVVVGVGVAVVVGVVVAVAVGVAVVVVVVVGVAVGVGVVVVVAVGVAVVVAVGVAVAVVVVAASPTVDYSAVGPNDFPLVFSQGANKGNKVDIEKLTVGEARQIAALFQLKAQDKAQDDSHWEIGKPYFLRTVTHHHQGRLVKVTPQELVLEDAAWIPDDGRFAQAVATSAFAEVEPFPAGKQVIIGRGSLVDAVRIDALNLTQK